MFTIDRETEAFRVLESMVTDPTTYKVSVAVRDTPDSLTTSTRVMFKRNEDMWTAPLTVFEVGS